eukprot:6019767-Pyramimonas_sp.AAC.1
MPGRSVPAQAASTPPTRCVARTSSTALSSSANSMSTIWPFSDVGTPRIPVSLATTRLLDPRGVGGAE